MHESFIKYKDFRYLKVALGLSLLSIIAYAIHTPSTIPNGGTWLGYTLGTIGAAIIGLLMWFGVRKRQYASTTGTLKGWLSGHIYLGTALIIVATLHTGFQFGWNIHTLAYVLMMLVIFSGFYGLYIYIRYPTLLNQHRAGLNREAMLREIKELDEGALYLASEISSKVHEVILRSIKKSKIGGSAWQQLTAWKLGEDPLAGVEQSLNSYKDKTEEGTLMINAGAQMGGQSASEATMVYVGNALKGIDSDKLDKIRRLLETVGRKKSLLKRVRRDIQMKAIVQLWLYFHVPLSMGLLAALLIHIITVFFYW